VFYLYDKPLTFKKVTVFYRGDISTSSGAYELNNEGTSTNYTYEN